MPTYHSKTLHQHADYKVQQEFERVAKLIQQKDEKAYQLYGNQGGAFSSEQKTEVINNYYQNYIYQTGIIKINKTVINPANNLPEKEHIIYNKLKAMNLNYGYPVYQILNHNLSLVDMYNYYLDLKPIREHDEDVLIYYPEELKIYQHQPMDGNSIFIFAVVKPNIHKGFAKDIIWEDEANNIVKTNVMYKYLLIGMS